MRAMSIAARIMIRCVDSRGFAVWQRADWIRGMRHLSASPLRRWRGRLLCECSAQCRGVCVDRPRMV